MATVERTRHRRGSRDGSRTLEQTFRFPEGIRADDVAHILRTAPLVGTSSIFGDRPGTEPPGDDGVRRLAGFSPAPGFRFDVELTEPTEHTFVAAFSQPARRRPYLAGAAIWWVGEGDAGTAELREEINTEEALAVDDRSLGGSRPSLRRTLFFLVGHSSVMRAAAERIAGLAASGTG